MIRIIPMEMSIPIQAHHTGKHPHIQVREDIGTQERNPGRTPERILETPGWIPGILGWIPETQGWIPETSGWIPETPGWTLETLEILD